MNFNQLECVGKRVCSFTLPQQEYSVDLYIALDSCYFFIKLAFLLQSLLCDPNPNSPANSEAARMFSENKREYNRRVREIVEQSWTAD